MWLQWTGQVLGPKPLLPPNQGRKESKATLETNCHGVCGGCDCLRGPWGCLFYSGSVAGAQAGLLGQAGM